MAYADATFEAPEAGLGKTASHEELYRIGLIYATGMGVAVDYVAAHKWFNLAASRGHEDAAWCRADVSDEMTAREIAEAQRRARHWLSEERRAA